jgi:tetratricopeptide (TPR) repeat protein
VVVLRLAVCCALLGSGLAGCATHGPLVSSSATARSKPGVELAETPFHPQRALRCGPASLATLLGASGIDASPEDLERRVFLSGRGGSLQVEMEAAPRNYARVPYPLGQDLDDVLAETAAGRPVLVLHNYGLPFWPRWHYAVVIGYESDGDAILLRSGTTRRQRLSARNFMRAWDHGGRWALVVLKPGELPAKPEESRYLQAAAGFERVATPADARLAFDAAVRQWPRQAVARVGRGTASYRSGDLQSAASDYAEALRLDPAQAGARNNLAMTLLDLGCPREASETLAPLDPASLQGPLAEAVRDTRAQIGTRATSTPCHLRPAP